MDFLNCKLSSCNYQDNLRNGATCSLLFPRIGQRWGGDIRKVNFTKI